MKVMTKATSAFLLVFLFCFFSSFHIASFIPTHGSEFSVQPKNTVLTADFSLTKGCSLSIFSLCKNSNTTVGYSLMYLNTLLLQSCNRHKMTVTSSGNGEARTGSKYDRESELKAFDDTKAGVKGLVDAGLTKLPRMFFDDELKFCGKVGNESEFSIPIIDLENVNRNSSDLRTEIVEQVRNACEKWGFFQVVNHGIPISVLDEMISGIRRFHEMDTEEKKMFYSRDYTKRVLYNTNFDFYSAPSTNWRDSLTCVMAPHPPNPEELPAVCRDVIVKYAQEVMKLASTLFELLSEALGLNPNHLKDMGCAEGLSLLGHYYPPCPESELTMGISGHADSGFLTVLLQDHIGGLQVLHHNKWVDVKPIHGALVVNLGDMIQLISNDKFVSAYHRALAKDIGPRISVACFLRTQFAEESTRVYGPIKELLSDENPPVYRETTIKDFRLLKLSMGFTRSALPRFRL